MQRMRLLATGAAFAWLSAPVSAQDVYVEPHMRSAPDGNFYNNWSTKGNVNPYTGQPGTRVTPPGYAPQAAPQSAPTPEPWGAAARIERDKERAVRMSEATGVVVPYIPPSAAPVGMDGLRGGVSSRPGETMGDTMRRVAFEESVTPFAIGTGSAPQHAPGTVTGTVGTAYARPKTEAERANSARMLGLPSDSGPYYEGYTIPAGTPPGAVSPADYEAPRQSSAWTQPKIEIELSAAPTNRNEQSTRTAYIIPDAQFKSLDRFASRPEYASMIKAVAANGDSYSTERENDFVEAAAAKGRNRKAARAFYRWLNSQ